MKPYFMDKVRSLFLLPKEIQELRHFLQGPMKEIKKICMCQVYIFIIFNHRCLFLSNCFTGSAKHIGYTKNKSKEIATKALAIKETRR